MGYETFCGIFIGIIEMTNGAKIIAAQNFSPNLLIAFSFLVSFGGLSVHMQSISFISKTDIKASLYLFSKFMHAIISAIVATILLPFFNFTAQNVASSNYDFSFVSKIIFSLENFLLIIAIHLILIFIACISKFLRKKI